MRKRGQKISFWTTQKEQDRIRRLAKKAGMGEGDYLRRTALGARIVNLPGLTGTLRELKAVGRNLNQLTLLSHTGRITVPDLRQTTEALERAYAAVNRLFETGAILTDPTTDGNL